jgi:hypothetical protein
MSGAAAWKCESALLHAVKDPLTPAAIHESKYCQKQNKTKPGRKATSAISFIFPVFERLQMLHCSAREEQ